MESDETRRKTGADPDLVNRSEHDNASAMAVAGVEKTYDKLNRIRR